MASGLQCSSTNAVGHSDRNGLCQALAPNSTGPGPSAPSLGERRDLCGLLLALLLLLQLLLCLAGVYAWLLMQLLMHLLIQLLMQLLQLLMCLAGAWPLLWLPSIKHCTQLRYCWHWPPMCLAAAAAALL